MEPFGNASRTIGGLTLESSEDRVAVYGSLDLPRSLEGLARARELKHELDAIVAYLERHAAELPASPPLQQPGRIDNPFC
jgi:hypothetical protein